MTDFSLPKRLKETTEAMANKCSVDMSLWCAHSAAALDAVLKIETLEREVEKLRAELEKIESL
jgi:hypothetical protein